VSPGGASDPSEVRDAAGWKPAQQGGNWAARTDRPKRSVFGNYRADDPDAADSTSAEPSASSNSAPSPHPAPATGLLQSAIDLALARSFLYRFLAAAFADPTPDGWAWLCAPATQKSLVSAWQIALTQGAVSQVSVSPPSLSRQMDDRAISENPGHSQVASPSQPNLELCAAFTPSAFDAFHDAYLITFGHAARGPCPINELEYGDLKADALFQPHRLADLAAFYRAFGLEIADDAAERPDHLCVELEFMAVLAAKEAWAREHQLDADALAVVRDAQKKFLREHLGRWTPAFTRRLEREAGPGPLTALARFTREFVLAECARCGVVAGNEDLLLRPVDETAESLCATCGITALPPGALQTT